MRSLPIVALALLLLIVVGAIYRPERTLPIGKTTVAVLPDGFRVGYLAVSDDGMAHAYVVQKAEEGDWVVGPTGPGPMHLTCGRPSFAPHSARLFYWAGDLRDGQPLISIVADHVAVPTEFTKEGVLAFSADASRWATTALAPNPDPSEPGVVVVIADGAEYVRGDDLSIPSFSPDGSRIAYLAKQGDRVALIVDGAERRTFDTPRAPCALAAMNAARHPDLPGRHVVRYLADGGLLVATRDPDGWGVYRDDARVASYTLATIDVRGEDCKAATMFAPASMRIAEAAPVAVWWERPAGDVERWRVVRNGRPIDDVLCDAPWKSQPPEVSPNGRHVAYACRTTAGEGSVLHVVHDGVRYGPYAEVWGFALSDGEGSHVVYGAVDLGHDEPDERPWSLYVDGRLRSARWQAVWRPRLGADGVTLAWEARRDRDAPGILGVNEVSISSFDDVFWGPMFQNNGRDVAWMVRRGRKLIRLTVDVAEVRRRSRR